MPDLVALDLPGGPPFVDALRSVWEAGDAAAPLDQRLPASAARAVLSTLAPTQVVDPDGERHPLPGGRPVEPGDALVMTTSGSTGAPRGVVLTHSALETSARATSTRLEVDPDRHSWLACLPLSHIGGMSVVTRSLATGTPLTVLAGFDAPTVEAIGRRREATHVSLVATAVRRIEPALFTVVLLGGSAPPGDRAPNVVATYGLTESGSGVVYDHRPLDGVDVAIGTGSPGQGSPGEVLLRGPMLLRAYRDGTVPFVAGPDGSGSWFPTGDAGSLGPAGELYVSGRLAEMINTGGEHVWPDQVESILATMPEVAEVAVWRRPDPEWGERVVAWVVPTPGAPVPSVSRVREVVGRTLPPWAAPKEVEEVPSLPRTPSGKVRRAALT